MVSKGAYSLVSYDGANFSSNDILPKQPTYLHVYGDKMFIGLKSERRTDTILYTLKNLNLYKFDSLKYLTGKEIRNISSFDRKLVVTGDVGLSDLYYHGGGLALFNRNSPDKLNQIISLNKFVNAGIINLDNTITIGGDFTSYSKYYGFGQGVSTPIFGCAKVFEDRLQGFVNQIAYEKPELPFSKSYIRTNLSSRCRSII